MKISTDGDTVFAFFEDGEDVINNYERLAEECGVDNAVVLSGIGMLRDAKIGYYKKNDAGKWDYEWKVFENEMELVSTSGNITTGENGKRVIHLHAALAGKDHKLHGGHLGGGTVCVKNEVYLKKLQSLR
ncbi:MAG: DUF296 domain-containing protein [Thermoplasmata archaeon HGW-Thermoplasmata-1]|nr:MAG: DUF296 domain-containing protein [Thermoplasmata archaeon HGW-Thermoplasmata-1]